MNIKQLSKLTGVNAETIRSYRKNGYLNPCRKDNGYYEYSINDYVALAHLRKLRGLSLSFDMIDDYYSADNNADLVAIIEREENELKRRTAIMKAELRYLSIEKQHILQSSRDNVTLLEVNDDKYDFFVFSNEMTVNYTDRYPDMYYLCTGTIRIRKEDLNSEPADRMIPIEAGIGTYKYILEENNIDLPENMINVVPKGTHICQIITIEDLTQINLMSLKPMMDYAGNNGYTFISDTTGFLMTLVRKNGKFLYQYRIRAAVSRSD